MHVTNDGYELNFEILLIDELISPLIESQPDHERQFDKCSTTFGDVSRFTSVALTFSMRDALSIIITRLCWCKLPSSRFVVDVWKRSQHLRQRRECLRTQYTFQLKGKCLKKEIIIWKWWNANNGDMKNGKHLCNGCERKRDGSEWK